jgi:hypothetical protein
MGKAIKVVVEFEDKIFELTNLADLKITQLSARQNTAEYCNITVTGETVQWKSKVEEVKHKFEVGDVIIGNKSDIYGTTKNKQICQVVELISISNPNFEFLFRDLRVRVIDVPYYSCKPGSIVAVNSKYFNLYKETYNKQLYGINITVEHKNRETKVKLSDGTIGIAKCQPDDIWSKEIGVLLAYARAREIQHAEKYGRNKNE